MMPTMQENTQAKLSLSDLENLLPPPPKPVGSYVPTIRVGNLVYTSGTLPMKDGQLACTGAVGDGGVSMDDANAAAKLCILNAISLVKAEVGGLQNIVRIVKVTGFVNSKPNFTQQPAVLNGASDFLAQAFGEAGKHVRSAVGVAALPLDASVEIEVVAEVK